MCAKQVTRELVEQRLLDNLRKGSTHSNISTASMNTDSNLSYLTDSSPSDMPFLARLRYYIVTNWLSKINLTSYRRLRLTTAALNDARTTLNQLMKERDEVVQLLRQVAADRDRLAGEIQVVRSEHDTLKTQVIQESQKKDELQSGLEAFFKHLADQEQLAKELQTALVQSEQLRSQITLHEHITGQLRAERETSSHAHTQLQKDYEAIRSKYDEISHKNAALEAVNNALNNRYEAHPIEMVDLPFTLKTDASILRSKEVTSYLQSRAEFSVESANDVLYYMLETSLRGSEEEIKSRQRDYLPYLTIVDSTLPVVDLGCGRGEFLELLREHAIASMGVDTNAENIAELKHKGLNVYHQDAIAYLQTLEPESVAGITSFQVIEHVSTDYLRKLLEVAHQKLVVGGFILLETVNPYCLETYRTFYLDPTHQKPVPVDLLSLLYYFLGFSVQNVFYQSPIQPKVLPSQRDHPTFLYQNYALLGTKVNHFQGTRR